MLARLGIYERSLGGRGWVAGRGRRRNGMCVVEYIDLGKLVAFHTLVRSET